MRWDEVKVQLQGLSNEQLKLVLGVIFGWLSKDQVELILNLIKLLKRVKQEG